MRNARRGKLPPSLVDLLDLLFEACCAEIAVLLGKATRDSGQTTYGRALVITESEEVVLGAVGGRVHSLHL